MGDYTGGGGYLLLGVCLLMCLCVEAPGWRMAWVCVGILAQGAREASMCTYGAQDPNEELRGRQAGGREGWLKLGARYQPHVYLCMCLGCIRCFAFLY